MTCSAGRWVMSDPQRSETVRPWRCRHGWHKWRFVSMSDLRRLDLSHAPYTVHLCTLVERCERCRLRRTRDGATPPKRPKMPAQSGSKPRRKTVGGYESSGRSASDLKPPPTGPAPGAQFGSSEAPR